MKKRIILGAGVIAASAAVAALEYGLLAKTLSPIHIFGIMLAAFGGACGAGIILEACPSAGSAIAKFFGKEGGL